MKGVECAIYPVLYPNTEFSDTGALEHHRMATGDTSVWVVSIARSFTRNAQSSIRAYAENRDLVFLYEKHLAMK